MSKLADAERRIDKYVDKNERLKNIRDEFREENQRVRSIIFIGLSCVVVTARSKESGY